MQCGIPGINKTYGVAKGASNYEPADADLPSEEVWSTRKYLDYIPEVFAAVRKEFGNDIHLLHDVHHRLTPIEAARLGKELEPYHLFWLEDAVPAENQAAFKLIREHTTTPLAVGKFLIVFTTAVSLFKTSGLIIFAQRLYTRAASPIYGASLILPHYFMCAPAAMAPLIYHPSAWALRCILIIGYRILVFKNIWPTASKWNPYLPAPMNLIMAFYPGELPGHGVDINEAEAAKYPYKRACLPVNRLEDGTLWDW